MADMAEQTIREMDKVAASMISGRRQTVTELFTPREREVNGAADLSATVDNSSGKSAGAPNHLNDTDEPSTSTQHIENRQAFVTFDNEDLNSFNFDLDFADLPDIDLFEYFDPGFKLPAVDAALGQNVDLSAFADLDFWATANLIPSAGPSS
ncbi:hypothetical protein LTR84_000072 [Exophiala bonariae]|uniref:Uncharacterized protein n=1 Tax=Exophiala bonariae TaxID=1690606 RepID=A0AAV9NPJ7_9EURO|nr:hypothetical protein LTR84_000072 [Exophiala bonariae]